MTGPMGWSLPDPARLDPPPGDPVALADLATRLDAAAAFLGDLRGRLGVAPAAACGWAGADAAAADAQVARVGDLARSAADALGCAAARVRRHEEVLTDVRQRLAQLRRAQTEDYGTAVARMGAAADPGTGLPGPGAAAAVADLAAAEADRGRVRAAMLGEVEVDAAATAAVLAGCGAVAGGGDGAGDVRTLEDLLPGWNASALRQHGADFADAFLRPGADLQSTEEAARRLLPWAGNGAVAAEVLTGLGADGVQEALRLLGDGSLSAGSALAGVMAAVLGAPVPTGAAAEVARARDVRHVDPDDVRTLDADHVALGMGVVLAAARRSGRPGPPPATVRQWGRQVIAREQALGEPIRERLRPSPALPGDPLEEVLGRLARADAGPQAAGLLRAEPTWTTLLARPWDDGGAAFAAAVERATAEPGQGDVVVRSGLRALGVGLADDGDPADWTVDRATAASVAPALADAVAARPEVVAEPLARAAAGAGEQDRPLLRGLGHLTTAPDAAAVLDRALGEPSGAPAVQAGYLAVREYGQRLDHALGEFAAQEEAVRRHATTTLVTAGLSFLPRGGEQVADALTVLSVVVGADGTWDASPDEGLHVRVPCGDPGTAAAYWNVAAVLGTPTAPTSPPTDWVGVAAAVVPGGERLRDVVEAGVGAAADARERVDAEMD
ncbi:MAG: hypothetical protein JHC71_16730 [Blastococcus sp.]|nr:hypothetical protein [Blastococcus sp.]